MEAASQWIALIALLVSIVNTVAVWVSRPGKLAKERHDALKEWVDKTVDTLSKATSDSLKAHDRRIQAVEGDQKHMPTTDDFHELSKQVAGLEASLKAQVEGLSHTVRRIDDYLREESR